MALITCRDAAFGYDGGVVLSGLTFTVETGDYLCVVGENGSGKSTLMKGLLKLKPPVSGEVLTGDGLNIKGDRLSAPAERGPKGFSRRSI
jgi:zinc transport system ATP-binding protein